MAETKRSGNSGGAPAGERGLFRACLPGHHPRPRSALAGAERTYAILDETEEAPDPPRARVLGGGVAARVTFDDVSFGYDPTRPVPLSF